MGPMAITALYFGSFNPFHNGHLYQLEEAKKALTEKPLFFIINSYTTGISHTIVANLINMVLKTKFGGQITSDEIGLKIKSSGMVLPCGATTKWFNTGE